MPESLEKFSRLVVIGGSAGGVAAVRKLLGELRAPLAFPVLIVLHRMKNVDSRLDLVLQKFTEVPLSEVEDKQLIAPNHIYIAPPNYHVYVEKAGYFALSSDELVNFSRPSIDVSMESIAQVMGKGALGVVLTGANDDGSAGLKAIQSKGGLALIQDPSDAEIPRMPEAAMRAVPDAPVLPLSLIAQFLNEYNANNIPPTD
jgi:two-component system chemotaxis response regulator CheB